MVKIIFKNNEGKEIDLAQEAKKTIKETLKVIGSILKKAGDTLENISRGEQ
ncbi:MAG: hypothetical protein H0Z22_07080 [Thermosipho sp. (in: Bacteria)]|nr:hypothetical protein [Thermosipho sp. (in: thermotogales)]